ncbi:hypothetical protein N0V84_004112 [Fusarium piperis]|uniref:Uncharacterized protein n=1 Tax=Fusarium piperis TaxID=1435070 RepID=A0A9W9BQ52_9HYPO|nr:hypothetical protein N0V84_004112 [Fusarium piperis]
MDCRVRAAFSPGQQETDLAKMVDVSLELVDPNNQFGQVKSASLTLTGPLVSIDALVFSDCQTSQGDLSPKIVTENATSAAGHHFAVMPDDMSWDDNIVDEWLSTNKGMLLLAIGESQHVRGDYEAPETYGIIVERLEDGNYARTGQWDGRFGFVGKHAQTPCEFRTETITIL